MLNPFARRASASALLALCLAACGGAEVLLVPLFEFGFVGTTTGGVNVQVFFDPDTPTTSSGNFTFVNMNVDANQVPYSGSFSGCSFSISTTAAVAAPIAARYSGRFTGNDRIELQPTSGNNLPTLVLQRQGTGTRVTGC